MIGIMADSHDNLPMVKQSVRLFKDAGCSLVIHAGDFVAPFSAREMEELNCPVKAVFGNCDGEKAGLKKAIEPFGLIQEAPLIFQLSGLHVLTIHLNTPVESYLRGGDYDLIIFGHTHKPEIRRHGRTLLVNPGETGGWLTGKCTVALLDPHTLGVEIIHL